MPRVSMPRRVSTASFSGVKSSPTTAITRTGVKKLAASAKWVAAPPRQRSARPAGLSMVSNATLPTTRIDMREFLSSLVRGIKRRYGSTRSSSSANLARVACGIASGLVMTACVSAVLQAQVRSVGSCCTAVRMTRLALAVF